jgi:hypothetical protein
MPITSPDLSTPSVNNIEMSWMQPPHIVHDPVMFGRTPSMGWEASLSEFVLKWMVELMKNVKFFSHDFKESQM